MRYETDGYRKAENVAPMMTVMITAISAKAMGCHWFDPMAPQQDLSPVGLQLTSPKISRMNNYLAVTF